VISAREQKLVFSSRLNRWKTMSACRRSAGRLFHSFRPAADLDVLALFVHAMDCVENEFNSWRGRACMHIWVLVTDVW